VKHFGYAVIPEIVGVTADTLALYVEANLTNLAILIRLGEATLPVPLHL